MGIHLKKAFKMYTLLFLLLLIDYLLIHIIIYWDSKKTNDNKQRFNKNIWGKI